MKKLFLVAALTLGALSNAQAGMKYECWTYLGGKPDKMVKVVADNKNDAVTLATAKFRDLGRKFDYIQCK